MLRIGLCDDIADARLLLQDALERALELGGWEAQFYQFSSGEGLLDWLTKHSGALDLVFLDMEMKQLSGIETARRLRALDSGLQLVFCTSYSDYVYDGYGLGALGYLLKPPTQAQLADVLARAQSALLAEMDRAYLAQCGDVLYRLPYASILYFSSERRRVHCVTQTRTISFYAKLDAVASEVGAAFVRIHQRHLVRVSAIARVEAGEVVLEDGTRLPISRSCRHDALLALTRSALEVRP